MPPQPRPEEPKEELSRVNLGASAPEVVAPGEEFTCIFAAYTEELKSAVGRELEGLDRRARSRLGLQRSRWAAGTEVTVQLAAGELTVRHASSTRSAVRSGVR